jgi:uncharacterized membrane protein YhhN
MNVYLIAYFVMMALNIAALALSNSTLHFVTKPLLMPLLAVVFYQYIRFSFNSLHKKIFIALFFSWLGDVFLMFVFKHELFFLAGLGSFLVAHIIYILVFRDVQQKEAKAILPQKWWVILPLITYFVLLVSSFFSLVPMDMKAPVAVYSFTIAVMAVMAINRYGRVNDKSFSMVLAGALLFMFSDSIIAINKFLFQEQMPYAGIAIMLLYCVGQFYIVRGISKQ